MASRSIPLRISPLFFLTAAIIGYMGSRSLMGTIMWIAIIFVSILVHEYGHAIAGRSFGQSPVIELTGFGGVTYATKPKLKLSQEFVVVAAGPFFGFCLFILARLIIFSGFIKNAPLLYMLEVTSMINLFWTILNLLPVMPMDGGQLMRIVFEAVFGHKGRFGAYITSMVISLAIALGCIFISQIFISVLFFFFAFQNFEYARQIRTASANDEDEGLKSELAKAEKLIGENRVDEAEALLDQVRIESREGMIFQLATQDLAKLKVDQKDFETAYDLLKPNQKKMSDTAKVLLHHAAYEMKDYPLVLKLAASCIVNLPDQKIVLRSAAAAASLKDVNAALGWLETANDYGCDNLSEVITSSDFDPIRNEKGFQEFVDRVTKTC